MGTQTAEVTRSNESLVIREQAEQIACAYLEREPAPGQPSTIGDANKVSLLLHALAGGNYRETACAVAGIPKETFYRWLKRADEGEFAAIALRNAVEKYEALAEKEMVDCVRSAATKGPQYWAAGATFLERKSPEKWGRRAEGNDGPKVLIQIGLGVTDVAITSVRDPG